ncbi:MAG: DEAD/DEAH box helicase family protein [Synergistaceae bacterium]
MKVNIVDMAMGSGKTCAAINYINAAPTEEKFIVITPYLTEVDRFINCCKEKNIQQPKNYGSKLNGLKLLIKSGENIVTTHSLFERVNQSILELIENRNYTLIMDEVAEVMKLTGTSKDDYNTILDKYAHIENNFVIWDKEDYRGRYEDYKRKSMAKCLVSYGEYKDFLWMLPTKMFDAFKNVYILTFMFDAQVQKYYYDFYDIKYKYLSVEGDCPENYRFTSKKTNIKTPNYKNLIHIVDRERLNRIGDKPNALSYSWYLKNKDTEEIKTLKNNCCNFVRRIVNKKASEVLWTSFKDYKPYIKERGYTSSFISMNLRATNDYRERDCVAYLVNRYLNPYVKNFFIANHVHIDEEKYALSEMLQFIWRSAIREEKPITVYVPSMRMRNLLIRWINENSN